MLDRLTGHIVHIDFGDCFEVTSSILRPVGKALIFCLGCHDERKISREDSISLDANVGQGDGGQLRLRLHAFLLISVLQGYRYRGQF